MPEFSKDNICYLDISTNISISELNKWYEDLEKVSINKNLSKLVNINITKDEKMKDEKLKKDERIFFTINIIKSSFSKNLKINNALNSPKTTNPVKNINLQNANDVKRFSFLKLQGN